MIIDAHVHLWKKQAGRLDDGEVYSIGGGRSRFGNEVRQMLPPYMINGENRVELLMANMDYAQVNGAVITQEYIDGNQDNYLLEAKKRYPNRIKICSLYEENFDFKTEGFDGIKICASRLETDLIETLPVFQKAEQLGMFISIDLAEGNLQVDAMKKIITKCPNVKIAIGHFAMVTKKDWEKQVALALYPNVFIECGGITWLFHNEFYPYTNAIKAIITAKKICGIEKIMWGSDYPRTMTAITYSMSKSFIEKTNLLSDKEKQMILGINAMNFYNWPEEESLPYIKNMVED